MITVISGTNRPNSNSLIVAKSCIDLLANKSIDAQLFSLASLKDDFLFTEMYNEHSINYKAIIDQYISSTEKFIFIISRYINRK